MHTYELVDAGGAEEASEDVESPAHTCIDAEEASEDVESLAHTCIVKMGYSESKVNPAIEELGVKKREINVANIISTIRETDKATQKAKDDESTVEATARAEEAPAEEAAAPAEEAAAAVAAPGPVEEVAMPAEEAAAPAEEAAAPVEAAPAEEAAAPEEEAAAPAEDEPTYGGARVAC